MISIVLITNDANWEHALNSALQGVNIPYNLSVTTAATVKELDICSSHPGFLFVVHPISDVDIVDLIHQIRPLCPGTIFTILTETADATSAVELMKAGAYDYIPATELATERLSYLIKSGLLISEAEIHRANAKKELEESRKWLLEAQLLARVASYEYCIKTRVVNLSDSFFELFHISQSSKIHADIIRQLIHPDDLDLTLELFYKCIQDGIDFRHEFRVYIGEKQHYILGTGRRKFNDAGKPIEVVGTIQDISEQKHIENTIRANESLLKSINQNIKEGIYRSTRDSGLVYTNQAFLDMFGYESADELNEVSIDALYADPGMRQQILKDLESGIKNGTDEVLFVRKDGSYFWGLLRSISTKDEDGILYFDGAIVDISDRKKTEVELKKAKEAAEIAASAKADFLSNMSHEIRTPMNAIIGLTDMLMQEGLKGKNLENLRAIKYSADNLLVIINDILDFSKIEAGKINFENINFNIQELMNDLMYSQKLRSNAKGIQLNLEMNIDVPRFIKGDPYRLNQILLNLTSNAIKFTNTGHVDINVSKLYEDENGIGLSISVIDTGIGIPQSKINSIFESFTQAYTDTSRKYGGTGLGLAITKRLVELQGGSIHVKSKVGSGTEFKVIMKFEHGQEIQKPNFDVKKNTKSLSGYSILVAEDNIMNQFVMQKLMLKWNATVHLAETGVKALNVLETKDVDLVLMDLQMPEMSGYDATEIVRDPNSIVRNHQVPIIALTADAFSETRKRVLESGFDDFVAKPFDQDTLFLKMKRQLDKMSSEAINQNDDKLMSDAKRDGLVDLSYFYEVVGDDSEMLIELLTMYLDQNPKEVADLKSMYELGSMDDVKRLAHKMKSSLGTLGLKSTVHVLSMIEKEALEGNVDRVGELITNVEHACEQARLEVNDIIDRISTK